jgi:CRISPR-associated protein Cmr1
MKQLEYHIKFNTPAFMGNAEQQAQWRTPPFKALLRQWWRVAYAAERNYQVSMTEMRHEEGLLFGHAWLTDDRDARGNKISARKSLVRIRLDQWDIGSLKNWQALPKVRHPEVTPPVGSDLYLGFGPITLPRNAREPALKANAAIQSGEQAKFSIAVPDQNSTQIEQALTLMDQFGTAGGRSRNGWGSFSLTPLNETPALTAFKPLIDWQKALTLDWPHAIGRDESSSLIWQTEPGADWKTVMRDLAIIKISMRTQFIFNSGKNAQAPEERHWLSHPITNHNVRAWGQGRLPNSLRFKVRPNLKDPKQLIGTLFHVPCLPPAAFAPDRNAIIKTWQRVHGLLDELTQPAGERSYGSIHDTERRAKLKPQLDSIKLIRV